MAATPRSEIYYAARLAVPGEVEEDAVAAFWGVGSLGVQVISATRTSGRPRVELHAWFPGRLAQEPLERRLARALDGAGVAPARPLRLRRVRARRWVEVWQKTLKPMRIGRRFLVVPEGTAIPPLGGRLPIRVRFGQAFGTGEHATTRMSLRILEASLKARDRVIDLGTGSGILSVAALRLGAADVVAIDNDPVALGVARETVKDNGVGRGVTLRLGDAGRLLARGRYDFALVNIGVVTIRRLLPQIAAALNPGGRAVLTGLLVEDGAAVVRQGRLLGLHQTALRRSGPWIALLLERPAAP